MPKSSKAINPFYTVLVVVGVLFVVTTCAYFVMTLRDARPDSNAAAHPLLNAIEKHGLTVLVIELALLGVATFGAIGTDDYWERRRRRLDAAREGDEPNVEKSIHETVSDSFEGSRE